MLESLPLEKQMIDKFRRLPVPKQQEALRFIEYLEYSTLSLEEVVAIVRSKSAGIAPDELNTLVESARQDFFESRRAA